MNIHLNKYGSGLPLVFFHGWGFDQHIWLSLVPELQSTYELILVDLPGFGESPMMEWADFKTSLLAQLPEQFAVVGWSMGGLYGTRLALEVPHQVTHLINICSSPRFLLDDFWPGVAPEVFTEFYRKLSQNSQNTLNEFIELQTSRTKFEMELGRLPTEEGLASGLEILDTWDFREQMTRFKRPACYMFGRLDPIVPVKTMRVMQEVYPHFNYVFFNRAAHMPFLSHPDLFLTELRGFIQ
ncbi:alpha/beta fold hydrolase [Legionella saoudiensis]|uniref:alpha/beta fold hydrolase n=1 Tax=Legionella saoudiensis TaxID=1750561 RepID=UPI00072FAEF9|nr:alpha/beta fold hydrolase [Legionella saoudiensis]